MLVQPCVRHWYCGSDISAVFHDSPSSMPAALNGKPTKSPTAGFSVLSCERIADHSPEKSVCASARGAQVSTSAADRTTGSRLFRNMTLLGDLQPKEGICPDADASSLQVGGRRRPAAARYGSSSRARPSPRGP